MSDQKRADAKGDAAPPKKGKKALILIVAGVLLLAGGGGGAAWYFLKPPAQEGDAADAHPRKKNRIYANLDPFTVNLADEGGERFVQANVVLEVANNTVSTEVTANMPAVRNAILMLLSSKQSKDLLTPEGKARLAGEIAVVAGGELGWRPPAGAMRKTSAKPSAANAEDGEESSTGRRKSSRRDPEPNPVEGVHFVHFIVQ